MAGLFGFTPPDITEGRSDDFSLNILTRSERVQGDVQSLNQQIIAAKKIPENIWEIGKIDTLKEYLEVHKSVFIPYNHPLHSEIGIYFPGSTYAHLANGKQGWEVTKI